MERTTVILPTFNRSKFLIEALESLFAQTLPPAEIIVADDGSSDDTPERMAAYGDRIRYVRKANSGKADTLNQCMQMATHPLIWIMDDDDLTLPNALMALTTALSGKPEIGFSYGHYERFTVDQAGHEHRIDCGYWQEVNDDQFLPATLQDFFVHHPGMLARKAAYDAVGPFSMRYSRSEDYEMLVRLARRFACAKTTELVFLQRQHDGERFNGLAADGRNARWIVEARDMFGEFHAILGLEEYLGRSTSKLALSPAMRRQALITRASVMARHKLWDLAFEDFKTACAIDEAQGPLTKAERNAVRSAPASKFGSDEILADPEIFRKIRLLASHGPVGRAITRTFARSFVWLIRRDLQTGQLAAGARLAKLSLSLAVT